MIVKCKLIPDGICLNLFGIYLTRDKSWISVKVINHEKIHDAQQRELLYIPFYILYLIEWLVKLLKYSNWNKAYYNISFEREAYRYGHDLSYLGRRKHYSWIKYLRSKD
ncbi:MAG: hypothetical protein K2K68_01810 [Duncaniella sp.]|nr:hypothetical protein [Duncaniella sp.]